MRRNPMRLKMKNPYAWIPVLGAALIAGSAASIAWSASEPEGATPAFDLSALGDGETRTFGEGDRILTATRSGDLVRVTLPGGESGKGRELSCTIGTDRCLVRTLDGGRVLIEARRHAGGDGKESVEEDTFILGLGGEAGKEALMFSKAVPPPLEIVGADGKQVRVVHVAGGLPGAVTLAEGERMLRCPEGDTTMTLAKDDTFTGYRCPRHGVELKEVTGKVERHMIWIQRDDAKGEPEGQGGK